MPSSDQDEVVDKVTSLVNRLFEGNFEQAFRAYDSNADGRIDRDELTNLLADAGIGSWVTRGAWAAAVIAVLDTSSDGCISWPEFEEAVGRADRGD